MHAYDLELSRPSFENLGCDAERLRRALAEQGVSCQKIDLDVLRELSPRLRGLDWHVQTTLRDGECIAVTAPGTRQLGLAVDLGTTKVAGYLLDLATGRTLVSKGSMNPQIAFGEDVVTRINRTLTAPDEARHMQELAVGTLNEMLTAMCAEIGARPEEIVDAVVVGNTAMHHLFLRLPARQLALAPYVPATSQALDVKARDVGLRIAAGAYVHLLPNIAGFVGADHVAMLLGIDALQISGVALALDIGTNTEVCLLNHGRMTSVSCASGPAFEGAHIKQGMRAAAGAIEHVHLRGERVEYHTIGGVPPVGLCGSGILDALAQLFLNGVVDRRGRMQEGPRVRTVDDMREFVLVSERERANGQAIIVTQRDVRELQLAKGAMRTGIEALLQANALQESDIDQVIIAGAFGSYIDVASAIAIGMLPALPITRFRQVGNAAGTGARLALISRNKRQEAQEIARRDGYMELATIPSFSDIFAQSMYLGEFQLTRG